MRAPGRTDRALARRGGARVFGCLTAVAIYGAATGQVPWLLPVLLGVLTVAARKVRAEVVAHDQWTGSWNKLLGPSAPGRPPSRVRTNRPGLGRRLGLVLFALPATWLSLRAQESGVSLFTCVGALLVIVLAGRLAMRLVPGLRRLAGDPTRRAREFTVAVCPALPARAPRPNVTALPPYCRQLLARQADPAAAAQAMPQPRPN